MGVNHNFGLQQPMGCIWQPFIIYLVNYMTYAAHLLHKAGPYQGQFMKKKWCNYVLWLWSYGLQMAAMGKRGHGLQMAA
jgi:hypothetical protein